MSKIEIFCVTNIPQKKLEALNVTLVGVGKNILYWHLFRSTDHSNEAS